MPPLPADAATASRVLHVLDSALDQSQGVKAEVEACAEDLGLVNDLARARMADGATTPPAAQALRNGLAVERRVQGQPTSNAADLHAAQDAEQDAEPWLLHYQPKVDLRTGALTGVEALVRWNHPLQGLVDPDRFIGLAEDCGAIGPLTEWVLRAALEQLARWQQAGLHIQMAVNVSMDSLLAPDFARQVGAWLRQGRLSPQDLVLEVTESRVMALCSAPLETLVRLRVQGFGLSIDNFGTGHSSLEQLRDVPFTELKIDHGFVHGARNNPLMRPMLESSIGTAQRLGLQTVAAGVETEDDWALLREIGCDVAQGCFIGRPMPANGLCAWLADWQLKWPRLTTA